MNDENLIKHKVALRKIKVFVIVPVCLLMATLLLNQYIFLLYDGHFYEVNTIKELVIFDIILYVVLYVIYFFLISIRDDGIRHVFTISFGIAFFLAVAVGCADWIWGIEHGGNYYGVLSVIKDYTIFVLIAAFVCFCTWFIAVENDGTPRTTTSFFIMFWRR